MSFLVEADICSAVIRRTRSVVTRLGQHQGQLSVSVVSVTALELWLLRPRTPSRYLQPYHSLLQQLQVRAVDETIAHRAASVGSALAVKGRRVGTADLLIAATALVHSLTLVTHNTQVFSPIPGLTVVDWLAP